MTQNADFRGQAGVIVSTGKLPDNSANSRKTELFDLENTDTYCEYNKDGPQVRGAVGGVISLPTGDRPLICGGWTTAAQSGCYFLGETSATWHLKQSVGFAASAVVGDRKFLWVTGGWAPGARAETAFITGGSRVDGPTLPIPLHHHCMVEIEENKIMVVGGHTGKEGSADAFIYDLTDLGSPKLEETPRPKLTTSKWGFGCGLTTDYKTGAPVVLVAGGDPGKFQEIERWIVGSGGNFEAKGTMELPLAWTSSVSHPSGVYFFGNGADIANADIVQKAYCYYDSCKGVLVSRRLQLKRMQAVAMLAQPNFCNCTAAAYTL